MRTARLVVLSFLALSACRSPMRTLGPTERALRFRALPPWMEGGLSSSLLGPGSTVVFPWEELYTVDVSERSLPIGGEGEPSGPVALLTADGAIVMVRAELRYRPIDSAEGLTKLLETIGPTPEALTRIVSAEVRDRLLVAGTTVPSADLAGPEAWQSLESGITKHLQGKLPRLGIEVTGFTVAEVIASQTKAARAQQIAASQQLEQEITEAERASSALRSKVQRELGEAKAAADRKVAEASAAKDAAERRGRTYLEVKQKEAAAIREAGRLELEGMKQRLDALAGPGGRGVLKLKIANELKKSGARFVVIDKGVSQTDTNKLIEQLGVLREETKKPAPGAPAEQRGEADKQP